MAIDHPNHDPNEKKKSDAPFERQTQSGNPTHPNASTPGQSGGSDFGRSAPQAQGPAPAEQLGTAEPAGPGDARRGARGTAAMDPGTRREVARKGGLAVSRNRDHMAEIGRKGGQSVSRNREHMARIGRKGGTASRGSGSGPGGSDSV